MIDNNGKTELFYRHKGVEARILRAKNNDSGLQRRADLLSLRFSESRLEELLQENRMVMLDPGEWVKIAQAAASLRGIATLSTNSPAFVVWKSADDAVELWEWGQRQALALQPGDHTRVWWIKKGGIEWIPNLEELIQLGRCGGLLLAVK